MLANKLYSMANSYPVLYKPQLFLSIEYQILPTKQLLYITIQLLLFNMMNHSSIFQCLGLREIIE